MNLNAYDNVVEKINKQKSWIDIKKKMLLSRELNVRDYVLLTKRYDNKYDVLTDSVAYCG